MLRKIEVMGMMNTKEVVRTSEYKRTKKHEKDNEWKEKRMHRVKDKIVDWESTWQWIGKGDLKGCTESLISSVREQALRTNYIRFHVDKIIDSPLWRKRGGRK